MVNEEDWRLQGQERYLNGVVLVRKKFRQYNETWDHDHCEFCSAKFMPNSSDPEVLTEGYATVGEYRWICSDCFDDFKDRFDWTIQDDT